MVESKADQLADVEARRCGDIVQRAVVGIDRAQLHVDRKSKFA